MIGTKKFFGITIACFSFAMTNMMYATDEYILDNYIPEDMHFFGTSLRESEKVLPQTIKDSIPHNWKNRCENFYSGVEDAREMCAIIASGFPDGPSFSYRAHLYLVSCLFTCIAALPTVYNALKYTSDTIGG
jgi:hypothetical protein